MSRSFPEAMVSDYPGKRLELVDRQAQSLSYPRLMLKIVSPSGKSSSEFVFLIRYHQGFVHLINPRRSFALETGRNYQFTFLFPDGKCEHCRGKISYQMSGNGAFGILLRRPSTRFRNSMGQILFQSSSEHTPKKIRESGLLAGSLRHLVHYHIIETQEEYQELLALRFQAYQKAGKISAKGKIEDMGDRFDQRSKILVAKHLGKIVASMRLILNGEQEPGEHEQFVHFPHYFPSRSEIIEITRVCTDPNYRGSDLLQGLFQFASKVTISLDRPWILGSSTPALLPLYRKIGFLPSELKYIHQDLNHEAHVIFMAHKDDILFGRNVGAIHWNVMYREVYEYATAQEYGGEKQYADSMRIFFYMHLGTMMKILKSSWKKIWHFK
ncbi:MAG: GNAT family N-acyltransferase [Oligoflexus sp.]